MSLSVKIIGPATSFSSYGKTAREVAIALSEIGIGTCLVDTTNQGDFVVNLDEDMASKVDILKRTQVGGEYITIHIDKPEKILFTDDTAKKNIVWTSPEVTNITNLGKILLNNPKIDQIWFPDEKSRSDAVKAGIDGKKAFVQTWGVDYDKINSSDKKLGIVNNEDFYFSFVGSLKPTTGFDVVLRAFYEEFNGEPKAKLVFKSFVGNLSEEDELKTIQRVFSSFKGQSDAEVLYIPGNLPDSSIHSILRSSDCVVLPARAKAWNTPAISAMAAGVPVITTENPYTEKDNSIKISSRIVPVEDVQWLLQNVVYQNCKWGDPNITELKQAMRKAFEAGKNGYGDIRKKATEKSSELDWKNVSMQIVKKIQKFEG